ncbi:hypothetical protein [Rhodohalobacter sulfatireducens]|uniref:Uncharacterized protein n=1 Tax=Rhodohalobacter sulfatireducens TaxID=2911366 RepID=A0ABS9KBL3_9BACT|nr:hypothetical protein [Rhodohalobacter sulfatireducens]MCG2588215.1 hypothetical protein [Rhodohalobacter sulfatireducens]
MNRKKIDIGAISTTLNRSEMREIMAGSGCGDNATTDTVICQVQDYDPLQGGFGYCVYQACSCAHANGTSPMTVCQQTLATAGSNCPGGVLVSASWGTSTDCSCCV